MRFRHHAEPGLYERRRGRRLDRAPDVKASAAKAQLDWLNAAHMGGYAVSPFAPLALSQATVGAHTETGGGFPASYDAQKTNSSDLRIGTALSRKVSDTTNLRFSVMAVHQFEDTTARTGGTVTGLYDFALPGQQLHQNWARATFDVDYSVSAKTLLTGGVNLATQSSDPTIGLTLGLKSSF
jgi:uncharacterized protein with beta-barrel porin domain